MKWFLAGGFGFFECREVVVFGERRFVGTGKGGGRVELDLALLSGELQRASWPQVDRELGLTTITSSSCC